ncbi:MAG: hypothetical protein ABGW77_06545 [Campylobacterales bacterium]
MREVKVKLLGESFKIRVEEEFGKFLEKRGELLEGELSPGEVLELLLKLEGELFQLERELERKVKEIERFLEGRGGKGKRGRKR